MSQRFAAQTHLVGLLFVLFLPVAGHAQELLAELPHVDARFQPGLPFPPNPLPNSLTFCLGYGVFQVGTPPFGDNLNPVICHQPPSPVVPDPIYFDFHAGNSPQFADLVSTLTNSTQEPLWACERSVGCTSGDGAEAALSGSVVGFIRLVVNRAFAGMLTPSTRGVVFDLVWQFWGGPPQFSGRGQRTEVNEFLQYRNPLESNTLVAAGTTSFPLTIVYGPTIDPSTFTFELNGGSFGGLTPVPGTTQTIYVPVSPGRNVLTFSVEGVAKRHRPRTETAWFLSVLSGPSAGRAAQSLHYLRGFLRLCRLVELLVALAPHPLAWPIESDPSRTRGARTSRSTYRACRRSRFRHGLSIRAWAETARWLGWSAPD